MIVVDASVLTWALAGSGARGAAARARLAADDHWAAPEHWKVEVFSSVRGMWLGGKLSEPRARDAVAALAELAVVPVAVGDLLGRMWELRGTVSAYDAACVAAAELREVPLVTADGRLAKAGGLRCEVEVI